MKKAIIYINQFFGQIGGEDKADYPAEIREGTGICKKAARRSHTYDYLWR